MDLEGEDSLGIKNSMYTEAERRESTRHAWGMANCPLYGVYHMARTGISICKGWPNRPELGCDCFSMEFRIFQNYFKGKSFTAKLQITL